MDVLDEDARLAGNAKNDRLAASPGKVIGKTSDRLRRTA